MEYNGTNLVLLMLHKCPKQPHLFPIKAENETDSRYFSTEKECKENVSDRVDGMNGADVPAKSSYFGYIGSNLVNGFGKGSSSDEVLPEGQQMCHNKNGPGGFDFGAVTGKGAKHVNWQREMINTNQMCVDYR